MHWYSGPWVWDAALVGGCWRPPAGLSGLDTRPLPEQAARGGPPGGGVFFGAVAPAALENRADYTHLGNGSWYDLKPTTRQRAAVPRRNGFAPAGDDLCGVLLSVLTDGADPSGDTGPRPIVPTIESRVELHCGGRAHHQRFRLGGGAGHAGLVRDVLRADFAAVWQRDRRVARKFLDDCCLKFGVEDWQEFVPVALRGDVPGRLPRETTITENFTRADSTTLMGNLLTWAQVGGTWGTFGNEGYKVTGGATTHTARAESDLSSADHYAQVTHVLNGTSTSFHGPASRHDAGAATAYLCANYLNLLYVTKLVAGAATNLSSAALTYANPQTYKSEANGSTIKSYSDGVEKVSVTDTSITGNLRTGIQAAANNVTFDNFEAADLGGGGGGVVYTQLERGTRGLLRGLWTGRV